VIVSNAFNLIPGDFRAYIFYFFGGYTCINTPRFYMRALEHHSAGRNNTVAFYNTIIHHNASHAYEYIIMYRATMNYGIVANGYIIADVGGEFLIGTVYNRTVLYVYLVSHFNVVHISSYHCTKPDTAIIAHFYIAGNNCIFSNKTVFTKFGFFTVYFFYDHCVFVFPKLRECNR